MSESASRASQRLGAFLLSATTGDLLLKFVFRSGLPGAFAHWPSHIIHGMHLRVFALRSRLTRGLSACTKTLVRHQSPSPSALYPSP